MKKYLLLITGVTCIILGILAAWAWFATQNPLIGIFASLIIAGFYILFKAWKLRGTFVMLPGKKSLEDKSPNTVTWYGVWDPMINRERGHLVRVEHVENPPGRPWAWENLGDKPYYHRYNIPRHADDYEFDPEKETNFRDVVLPDKKFLDPGIMAKLLTLPSYTKCVMYFKQEIDKVPLMLLAGIILAEIIGLVIVP